MKIMRRSVSFVLLFLFLISSASAAHTPVKNIIFMIGDGMGFQHVAAGRLAAEEGLVMDSAPVKTSVSTHTLDGLVTDSGAAGTALATGYKTVMYRIGMDSDGNDLYLITEAARDAGKSVGIATNSRLTDATPAAFSAHVKQRNLEDRIAVQQMEMGFHLFLGGGSKQYNYRMWYDEPSAVDMAVEKGFHIVHDKTELAQAGSLPLLGLFAEKDMISENYRHLTEEPSLAEMTAKAIELLSENEQGFFLMVEGALIDKLSHGNDAGAVPIEVKAFDDAVRVAAEFAQSNSETLVVVTADHETGGLLITEEGTLKFTTTAHTGVQVPLFVFGNGATAFNEAKDNTDIPRIAAQLGGLDLGGTDSNMDRKVKVMVWNIHNGVGSDAKLDLDRFVEVIQAADVDVVGFNEVDYKTRRSEGVDQAGYIAEQLGWNYYYGGNFPYQGGQWGNAILTRYPILSTNNTLLDNPKVPKNNGQGILHTVLDIDGIPVNFFVTHLEAHIQEIRFNQAKQAMRVISQVQGPKIVLGDLNALATYGNLQMVLEPEIPVFLKEFADAHSTYRVLTDWETAKEDSQAGYLGGGLTFPANSPGKRIDYILASFDLRISGKPYSAQTISTIASDHLPFVAEVVIPSSSEEKEPSFRSLEMNENVDLTGINIGILVSEANEKWYGDLQKNYDREIDEAITRLQELGACVSKVQDDECADLSGLDVFILPDSRYISLPMLTTIREFAAGNGGLLAFGQASLEVLGAGGSKGNFELADLFGADFVTWQKMSPLHKSIVSGDETFRLGKYEAVIVKAKSTSEVLGFWADVDGTWSHPQEYNGAIIKNGSVIYVGENLFAEENLKEESTGLLMGTLIQEVLVN